MGPSQKHSSSYSPGSFHNQHYRPTSNDPFDYENGNSAENVPLILESIILSKDESQGPGNKLHSFVSSLDLFPKIDPKYLRQSTIGGVSTMLLYSVLLIFIILTVHQSLFPPMTSIIAISQEELPSTQNSNATSSDFYVELDISVFSPCQEIAVRYASADDKVVLVSPLLNMESLNNNSCRVYGKLSLSRTPGSLQFIPIAHLEFKTTPGKFDLTRVVKIDPRVSFIHRINRFEFGDAFPNRVSPLFGVSSDCITNCSYSLHQYFINIIPTTWCKKSIFPFVHPTKIYTFQYAAQSYHRTLSENAAGALGIVFDFDFESVVIEKTNISFLTTENGAFGELSVLIIQLMGILGGLGACSDGVYFIVGLLSSI